MNRWISPMVALALACVAGEAHAEKLVRCQVTLERTAGSVVVPGFGLDEASARERARQAAWNLAWADRWPATAAGITATPTVQSRRDEALRKRLDPDTDWQVPGYAVRPGDCTTETLTGERGKAWQAMWEREERKVVRDDPSVALESARRRECWGGWSHRMIKAAELGVKASEERYATVYPPSRAATDGLLRCMASPSHRVEPAAGPLEGAGESGTVQCSRPRRLNGAWTAAPGWGDSLESAREATLQRDLGNQLRRAEAGLDAIARTPDAAKRAEQTMAVAMGNFGGMVVGTDLAEQALLICSDEAPKTIRPVWTPSEALACSGWPTGTATAIGATPDRISDAWEQRCQAAFRQDATSGDWGRALRCSASCRTDAQSVGWEPAPIWRSSEPPRRTVEDAEKLVSEAVGSTDFHLFGIATGGLVFEAQYAAAFKADPAGFWGSIAQARAQGSWEALAYWEQVAGAWVLAFKDGR